MSVTVYSDTDTLSRAAAEYIVHIAQAAIAQRGHFTIALSGGSTPKKLYGLLATEPYRSQIDWAHVEVFWADERCVAPDDEESNYRLAHEVLLSKVPLSTTQIHRMPAEQADRDAASETYANELRRVLTTTDGVPSFDLLQLGMGPEAHTASLFPHQSSLHEQERLVMPVTVPKPPPPRLTLTPPVLNAAAHVLFLVTGAEKDEAVQAVLEGPYQPDEYPAQVVRPTHGEIIWMLDRGAAQKLQRTYS